MKAPVVLAAAGMALFAADQRLTEGNPSSPVRVIVYEDLQCPDCAAFRQMMDRQILPKYGTVAAFEHRDFPLPKHAWARPAAVAARYFHSVRPELGLEWRRYALANLREITKENFSDRLSSWAEAHGADPGKAIVALTNPALTAAVENDYQDGVARGIAHTPTVMVNDDAFVETFTFEDISRSLDKAAHGR